MTASMSAGALVGACERRDGIEFRALLAELAGAPVPEELALAVAALAQRASDLSSARGGVVLGDDDVVVSRRWVRDVAKESRRVLSEAHQREVRAARDAEGRFS